MTIKTFFLNPQTIYFLNSQLNEQTTKKRDLIPKELLSYFSCC